MSVSDLIVACSGSHADTPLESAELTI